MEVQVSGPGLAEHFHSHQRLRLLYLGSATLYTVSYLMAQDGCSSYNITFSFQPAGKGKEKGKVGPTL